MRLRALVHWFTKFGKFLFWKICEILKKKFWKIANQKINYDKDQVATSF